VKAWAILGAILLCAPAFASAAAAPATGMLYAGAGIALPRGAELRATPSAALLNDTTGLTRFVLTAPLVHVQEEHEHHLSLGVVAPVSGRDHPAYDLHNVTVTAVGIGSGWLGLVATTPARLDLGASAPAFVTSASGEVLTNSLTSSTLGTQDDEDQFGANLPAAHLDATAAGSLEGTFGGRIKLDGLTLEMDAQENQTTLATGHTQESALQATQTWVVLSFDAGTLHLASSAPLTLAASDASASWQGPAYLGEASGTFQSDGTQYAADGGPLMLDGTLSAALAPETRGGALVTATALSGVVAQTSALAVETPQPLPRAGAVWGYVLGGTALAAAAALGAWRLLRPREDPAPEDLLEMASLAAGLGDHATALAWIRRAIRKGPETARLRIEEAAQLAAMGDVAKALRAYDRAAALTRDGEPQFLAALLLDSVGSDPELVETRLREALERTPILAVEAEQEFRRLHARPGFRAALRVARQRIA
jgi:tetratricopeptide (TPR) repeat protein